MSALTSRCATAILLAVVAAACSGQPQAPGGSVVPTAAASTPQAVLASPTPKPTATPWNWTPPPLVVPALTRTFRSPTMGYSVRYPEGWTVYPATERWLPDASDFWDEPNGDRIESAVAIAGFRGGSLKLPRGESAAQWISKYLANEPKDCGPREQIPLGGATATINLNGCAGLGRLGGRVYDVVVGIGGRVYNFTMEGGVNRPILDAFLATLSFDPASALDGR